MQLASSFVPIEHRAPAVRVENLRVRFRSVNENPTLRSLAGRFRTRSKTRTHVEALRGVSFDVPAGAVYGVIGNNGAGKSTLFRVIAGILPPTSGRVVHYGRVTPLLSLGLGFNKELSGRENVLLGGLAQGLSAEQIAEAYHDIVTFADLGDRINHPMKTYSSGMFGRLGFAIAAHLDPEILLIDEALSAGDASFKRKCMAKLIQLCESEHCTVMIVSHGLEIVKFLGDRCLWLEQGMVRMEGDAGDVIAAYMENEGVAQDDFIALEDA